jgi:hypothetical protein
MHTGQTMLIIAAFAVLSTVTLAVNSTLIGTVSLGVEMEASLNALSIAQSMLDEVLSKDFDQNTTGNHRIYTYDGMSLSSQLGPDGIESTVGIDSTKPSGYLSPRRFNDVDDYRGYRRMVLNSRLGWFTVVDSVVYVNELDPNITSTSQTWQKRIVVTVTNPYMPKDIEGQVIPYRLEDIAVYRKYF